MQNGEYNRDKFIEDVVWEDNFSTVFELLSETYFWIKDLDGRFIKVNKRFVELAGKKDEMDMAGLTDFDIWPEDMATEFVQDDNTVIATGKNIVDRVEYLKLDDGSKKWFSVTKFPLKNNLGEIIGTAGISRDLQYAVNVVNPIMKMVPVIDYIRRNYNRSIDISELAIELNMNEKVIRQKFIKMFQKSLEDYIFEIRIEYAVKELIHDEITLEEVASNNGFENVGEFNEVFKKFKSMSPELFRKTYQQLASK